MKNLRNIARSARILSAFALLFLCAGLRAADNAQSERAFGVATQSFRDGFWERAEREMASFTAKFPDSAHVPEAILLQAQSRFRLKKFDAVVELLNSRLASAGAQADEYLYWIAESEFENRKFAAASSSYSKLLKQSPNSPLRLRASYGEAFAAFRAEDLPRAADLLRRPDGHFRQAAAAAPADEVALRGELLLGEVLYRSKDYKGATEALSALAQRQPAAELEWQRVYLLTQVDLAAQRADAALARTTNLLAVATAVNRPEVMADSIQIQAGILEAREPERAIEAYEKIAHLPGLPVGRTRQAILKSIDLASSKGMLTNAISRLKNYLSLTNTIADPAIDLLRFTLGELQLKQHYRLAPPGGGDSGEAGPAAETNFLFQARNEFDFLILNQTNSPFLGKAWLNRGWCLWEEAIAPGGEARMPESLVAFQTAAERLPKSEDQAVARFKWADCQFWQGNYTNAIQNYELLLVEHKDSPPVKSRWFDQALSQIFRASLAIHDLKGARRALDRLLAEFPASPVTERTAAAYGQALLDAGEASSARAVLADFLKRYPSSALKPEAELGIARSYGLDSDWSSAIRDYERWTRIYTNHPARDHADYDRAIAWFRSGNGTNAVNLLTNLVAEFPKSRLAPLAQFWVGDYYFALAQYDAAEASYKSKVLLQNTNTPSPELAYQARLMAARAAFARQGYSEARSQLTNLLSEANLDTNAPAAIAPQGYYLLGMIDLNEPAVPGANPFEKFRRAGEKFAKVPPGSDIEARAQVQTGFCYLQLAVSSPDHYGLATNAFQRAMDLPLADAATRSEAEVLLGSALERMARAIVKEPAAQRAMLNQAFDHYLNVLYAKNVRADQGELPEMHWVRNAGTSAGTLAEQLQRWPEAIRIYERLRAVLPALRDAWDKKIESLATLRATAGNLESKSR